MRWGARRLARWAAVIAWLVPRTLAAQGAPVRSNDPNRISGIEEPAVREGDTARAIGDAALWPLRQLVDGMFYATGVAAGLIEDEQVVPRVKELLDPPVGEVHAFPTAFAETNVAFDVGVRMLARARRLGATARVGYGGPDALVAESRLRLSFARPVPAIVGLEAFADTRERGYPGIGNDPLSDARNPFAPGVSPRGAKFRENRERFIATLGVRPLGDFELLSSTSLTQRRTYDARSGGPSTLSRVFVPAAVPGAFATTRFVYTEAAIRLDTRASRASPSTGVLFEGYSGLSEGVGNTTRARFSRHGGRAAAYFAIAKSSNILSPRIVLDAAASASDVPIPFNELPSQPDFRGAGSRIDFVSSVASLDYRWAIWRYLAARLFVDGATVAPTFTELAPGDARWAAGAGLDLFSRSTLLGSFAISGGPDGARVFLSIGVASGFGDRQHRN